MESRRKFLRTSLLVASAASLPFMSALVRAQEAGKQVDVVKVMSFSCPVCRASESQDRLIERAVKETGGRLIRGPIPSLVTEDGTKEQVYYASRNISMELSEELVELFYKGQQDLSIPLDNVSQVYVYLQQQLIDMPDSELDALFAAARQPGAKTALGRAVSLAYQMGIDDVPSYILVADGVPQIAHSPTTVGSSSLSALREEVINSIKSLSKGN